MFRKKNFSCVRLALLAAFLLCGCIVAAQEKPKLLDRNDPRLNFSFPIQGGGKPLRFKVQLDKGANVTGVSVFHDGDSLPFQTLPIYGNENLPEPVTEEWQDYEIALLVNHADLNFDGFEDLELLLYYIPHLDKKLYCVYLWDNATGHFIYSKELTDVSTNLVSHPENKTLTEDEDWQGGPWEESTYHWKSGKLELIEQDGLYGDWSTQTEKKCGFEFNCNRLIRGKMVTTLAKPVCTVEEMSNLPACPVRATHPAPKASTSNRF